MSFPEPSSSIDPPDPTRNADRLDVESSRTGRGPVDTSNPCSVLYRKSRRLATRGGAGSAVPPITSATVGLGLGTAWTLLAAAGRPAPSCV